MYEIQLRRREAKSHLPAPVLAEAKKILSSHFDKQGPLKGIDGDEERELIAALVGMDVDEKELPKVCREFWADLRVPIPSEGYVLNITTREEGGKKVPVNIRDYLIYKWALKHKLVAKDKRELFATTHKQFYIHDPEIETNVQNQKVSFKKKAYEELINIQGDEKRLDMLITLLTEADPKVMSYAQKENYLDEFIENDPEKFVVVATDKDLELKSEIAQYVSANILKKIGNQVWFIDQKLGDTVDEAVLFFKDKKQSETVNVIRAKAQEALK